MTAQSRNHRVSMIGTFSVRSHGRDSQISCFPISKFHREVMLHNHLAALDFASPRLELAGVFCKKRSFNRTRVVGSNGA